MGNKTQEPYRYIPTPEPDDSGIICGSIPLSSTENKVRACLQLPTLDVLPVIFVPGIMGSNLRATLDSKRANRELKPGEEAWRPPNSKLDGLDEAGTWKERFPEVRQKILSGPTLDVDPSGKIEVPIDPSYPLDVDLLRSRGWGEVHWDSYGKLLLSLERGLNTVYQGFWGERKLSEQWKFINAYDRNKWGSRPTGAALKLTEAEFRKLAKFHNPVYAFGYNWLLSNEVSAKLLEQRVEQIISSWNKRGHHCKQVILITHSMGGLVARACAKKIPSKIAGILHSVMPALGAPVCYRRIACGTESSSPSNYFWENLTADKFADIAGRTAADTTPVMATAPGPLELLPTHRYPGPWLYAEVRDINGAHASLELPIGSPYELYKDTGAWYRLIDPGLADPANQFKGKVGQSIQKAINQAENFHTKVLDDWYHPNSYAIYGSDRSKLSYGSVRWAATGSCVPTRSELRAASLSGQAPSGERTVTLRNGAKIRFLQSEQDVAGDGTVPEQSGRDPEGKVKQVFRTDGYAHQDSYKNESMLYLTLHLVARIAQDAE